MRRLMTVIPLIAVLVSTVGAVLASTVASADFGPDTTIGTQQYPQITEGYGKTTTQGHSSYVVSDDGGLTDISPTTIKIYVPASITSTTITVNNYDMCTSTAAQLQTTNSYDQSFTNTSYLAGSSNVVATYTLTGGTTQSFSGRWSDSCTSSTRTLTLSGATVDSSIGYRTYRLTVTGNPASSAGAEYVNLFWLSGANGVIFSQDSSQGVRSFGYQLSDPIPIDGATGNGTTYYRTALPFGSACSVKSNTNASISFYDLDYPGNSVVQPKAPNIQVKDITAGNTGVPLTRTSSGGSISGGSAGNQYAYNISGGNQESVTVQFTAKPGHRYILWMSNIFYNNTLQFKLPYDSIYYYATCQNANLQGNTTLDNQLIMPGQVANWTHQMANTDNVGTASNVTAQINRTITDKNGAVTSTTSTPLVTSATMGPNSKNPDPPKQDTFTATPADIGSTICEWISWTWDGGSGTNQSNDYCTVVAKQPKIHILGGDVRIGGQVDTGSLSDTSSGKTYGSWVEYGALIGSVTDPTHINLGGRFGSGASQRGGLLSGGDTSPLTFSNTTPNFIGQFGDPSLNNQDLTTVLKTNGLPACTPASLSAGGCTTNAGSLSLNGNPNVTGTVYINAPNATVTINGDIKYASGIASIGQLPQVVIYAKSIVIKASVGQVDAWLLTPPRAAGGTVTLATCDGTPATCTGQLTIHGPAATKNLSLPRSYGSDDANTQDNPAETFDLRADSYLWMYSQAAQNYSPQTAGVTNLPPRY